MDSWLVPPIVVPILLMALVAGYALYRGYL
jgi:hypothetical protein